MTNGGVIGKPNIATSEAASGVWSLNEAFLAISAETWPGSAAPLDVDFLVIAGGGGSTAYSDYKMSGGGGAGGYLNSYGSEPSGGDTASLSTLPLDVATSYTLTVGAGGAAGQYNGANSIFSGTDRIGASFNHTATGGGFGGTEEGTSSNRTGSSGGSGGGGCHVTAGSSGTAYDGSAGTSNQGTSGGDAGGTVSGPANAYYCSIFSSPEWCLSTATFGGGGGGGAGAAGSDGSNSGGGNGGAGLASSITGGSVTRAGGGAGTGRTGSYGQNVTNGSAGAGQSQAGGGANAGSSDAAGNNGTVILRYPNFYTISVVSGSLSATTATDGADKVTTFTAGSGSISFSQ